MRQGCPLSPLLFSFMLETLVAAISTDRRLPGLPVSPGPGKVTVVPFADDVTILASKTREVNRALKHIQVFEKASGAKLNRQKTNLLVVSREGVDGWGFNVEGDQLKVLGINVGIVGDRVTKRNWDMVISRVKHLINRWRLRGLSLRGKDPNIL